MLLIKAVQNERFQQAKMLLNVGANVNHRDDSKKSALIHASQLPNVRARAAFIKLLLKRGASATLRDENRRNVVSWACYYGYSDVLDHLLRYFDAETLGIDEPDCKGNTPLLYAASSGNLDLTTKLCRELQHIGVTNYVDRKNWYGETPLTMAFRKGHLPIVRYFLRAESNALQELFVYIFANREQFERETNDLESYKIARLLLHIRGEDNKSLKSILNLLVSNDAFRSVALKQTMDLEKLRLGSGKQENVYSTSTYNTSDKSFLLESSNSQMMDRTSLSQTAFPNSYGSRKLIRVANVDILSKSSKELLPLLMDLRGTQMSDTYRKSFSAGAAQQDILYSINRKRKGKKTAALPELDKLNLRDVNMRRARGNSFSVPKGKGWSVLKNRMRTCSTK